MNVQLLHYCNPFALILLCLIINLLPCLSQISPSSSSIATTAQADGAKTTSTTITINQNKSQTSFLPQNSSTNKSNDRHVLRRSTTTTTLSPTTTLSTSSPLLLSSSALPTSTITAESLASTIIDSSSNSPATSKTREKTGEEKKKAIRFSSDVSKIRTFRQVGNRVESDEEEEEDDSEEDDEEEEEEEEDDEEEVGAKSADGTRNSSGRDNSVESWVEYRKIQYTSSISSLGLPPTSPSAESSDGTKAVPAAGGPVISSIRHHKSRKSFQRTRKVKKPSEKLTTEIISASFSSGEQADQPVMHYPILSSSSSSSSPSASKRLPVSSTSFPPPSSSSSSLSSLQGGGGTRKLFSPLPPQQVRQSNGSVAARINTPVGNDSSGLVFGKPYFTPVKQQNATSLNRIKNFLLRNVSLVGSRRADSDQGLISTDRPAAPPSSRVDYEGQSPAVGRNSGESVVLTTVGQGRRRAGWDPVELSTTSEVGADGPETGGRVGGTNRRLRNKSERNNKSSSSSIEVSQTARNTRRGKNNKNRGIKGNKGESGDNQNKGSRITDEQSSNNNVNFRAKGTSVGRGSGRKLSGKSRGERVASGGATVGFDQQQHNHHLPSPEQHAPADDDDDEQETLAGTSVPLDGKNDWWWNQQRRTGEHGSGLDLTDGDDESGNSPPDLRVIVPGIGPEELLQVGKIDEAAGPSSSSSYFPESVKDENVTIGNQSNVFSDYNLLGSDEEEIRDVLGGEVTSASSPLSSSPTSSGIGSSSSASLASSFSSSSTSSKTKPDLDIVTKFLRIVETQHTLGDNCTAGTAFSLGEGVVDRYAQERFRLEAEIAVNRANMLTRLWKYAPPEVLDSEYLLHASLFSMVEFDDDIFAAGNCYDKLQYKNYTLFCPFAYRLPEGNILVKDLAVEYKYLSNTSEWFYIARKNAERVIKNHNQFSRGFHSYTYNESTHTDRVEDEILNVTYDDGKWSKPYFDCGGGNIWMMTYTVPFFGYKDGRYFFKGTSGIDIDLRRVDIDQCPLPENSTELNIFAASDKCKKATTKCIPIKGLGFRRGSYRCECQPGYYFPNTSSTVKFFNGTVLEEEYEKKLLNEETMYDEDGAFECLRCLEGCDTCVDDRPCVVTLNWLMRSAILILQCAIIAMLPIVGLFTWKYSDIKVVRAASPVLLRFIVLGAFLIYCTILVLYPSPSVITCTIRVWLREIGFSLAYGALMLKTWRISVIFRVRSAKAVKITDLDLMKRLGVIVAIFTALLVIRTLVAPPVAIVSLTADDLKAWLCKTDWWDHSFTIMELLFLVWGIRLCIVVRKAPSEFNESKFISLAIYNEFLLSVFLNISMLFLQSPANPDLLYIICFCHVQLTMTLLLCLIFGSKAYMVFRGHGKGNPSDEARVPTFISKSRSGQKAKQHSGQNSTTGMHSSTTSTSHAYDPNFNSRLSEDVQEEFRRLYYQLEELKERNMRFGNRHLVAKIRAMQEAADSILGTNTTTGSSNCHLQPGAGEVRGRDSSSSSGGGGGAGGNDDGPTSNALSDITEEDNNGSEKCTSSSKETKKRLSFFGRVKMSPKGLVPTRSSKSAKQQQQQLLQQSNSGSESGSSGASGKSPRKTVLAGSKSAHQQQLQKQGSSKRSKGSGAAPSATTSEIERDEEEEEEGEEVSGNVILAHGGVYIGEVKPERPTAGSVRRRTSAGLNDTSNNSNHSSSSQQQPVIASVQVHPNSDTDRSELTSKCDYLQNKQDDQANCSTTTTTSKGECIAMNLIRLPSSLTEGGGMCETSCVRSNEPAGSTGTPSKKSESDNSETDKRNHSGSAGGGEEKKKLVLDLNDKSRFTEEITV